MKNNKIDKSTGGGESQLPAVVQEGRVLTAREFRGLAQVPPEARKAITTNWIQLDPSLWIVCRSPAQRLIDDYLDAAGHRADFGGPLFRPVKNNSTGLLAKPLNPQSLY